MGSRSRSNHIQPERGRPRQVTRPGWMRPYRGESHSIVSGRIARLPGIWDWGDVCSVPITYPIRSSSRADDGTRTRDPHLGKVMLYQLSHVRVRSNLSSPVHSGECPVGLGSGHKGDVGAGLHRSFRNDLAEPLLRRRTDIMIERPHRPFRSARWPTFK